LEAGALFFSATFPTGTRTLASGWWVAAYRLCLGGPTTPLPAPRVKLGGSRLGREARRAPPFLGDQHDEGRGAADVSKGRSRKGGKSRISGAARPYCVIPFLLPPPKNPCPARAQTASQAGRRRFDPGGSVLGAQTARIDWSGRLQPHLFRRPTDADDADLVATVSIGKLYADLAAAGFIEPVTRHW